MLFLVHLTIFDKPYFAFLLSANMSLEPMFSFTNSEKNCEMLSSLWLWMSPCHFNK